MLRFQVKAVEQSILIALQLPHHLGYLNASIPFACFNARLFYSIGQERKFIFQKIWRYDYRLRPAREH